jgi:hypothetical protein
LVAYIQTDSHGSRSRVVPTNVVTATRQHG